VQLSGRKRRGTRGLSVSTLGSGQEGVRVLVGSKAMQGRSSTREESTAISSVKEWAKREP